MRGDSVLQLAHDLQTQRAHVNEMLALHGPLSPLALTARLELRRLEREARGLFA